MKEYFPEKGVDKNQRTRRERTLELIGEISGKRILDIGCGHGFISGGLVEANEVYGLDTSPEALMFSSKLGLKTKRWDVQKGLPFKPNFFDLVLATEVLEHILDTDALLSEIKKVLKKNGTLIVSVPNVCSFASRVRVVLGRLPSYVEYRRKETGSMGSHIRGYNLSAIKNQLSDHGFEVEDVRTSTIWLLRFLVPWPWRFMRSLGEVLILKARKLAE